MESSLSEVDRKILRLLLSPPVGISSKSISEQTGIPMSTIQRRRARLESEYIETSSRVRPEKFGWRRITFLISTGGGASQAIGKELLARREVTSVTRTIGEHTIDLVVECFFRGNSDLLDFQEYVKGIVGVRDAMWTEVVEVMGTKNPPNHLLFGEANYGNLQDGFGKRERRKLGKGVRRSTNHSTTIRSKRL